jgi:hypothetical protein
MVTAAEPMENARAETQDFSRKSWQAIERVQASWRINQGLPQSDTAGNGPGEGLTMYLQPGDRDSPHRAAIRPRIQTQLNGTGTKIV